MADQFGECDVCGKPATSMARDFIRHEHPSMDTVAYSPTGGVKKGCDEHPVESVEHLSRSLPPGWKGQR